MMVKDGWSIWKFLFLTSVLKQGKKAGEGRKHKTVGIFNYPMIKGKKQSA